MALKESLKNEIEKKLSRHSGEKTRIKKAIPVHGGDIHSSFQLVTDDVSYFLKTSPAESADLFKKEWDGLRLLKGQKTISTACPISYGKTEKDSFLLMEYIEKGSARKDFWEIFAKGVADMHRHTNDFFGLEEDNYIGSLPQSNQPQDNWPEFYISQRLQPLIKDCIDQKMLEKAYLDKAMHLYNRMPEIFPGESPALLHGDFWGGNYLCNTSGEPCIFDPAVYYGHREIDLAMARLFGGFDRRFFWHYEECYPLSEGWQKRISLCQLYPLLVHSLLFGGGYVQRVKRILEEYE